MEKCEKKSSFSFRIHLQMIIISNFIWDPWVYIGYQWDVAELYAMLMAEER